MLASAIRFTRAPSKDRSRMLRDKWQQLVGRARSILPFGGSTYWAYRPDSDWLHLQHPELAALMPKWLRGNRSANAGDIARLYALVLNLKRVLSDNIPGDFSEVGVYKGNSAAVLTHFASGTRRIFLFDTFAGFSESDLVGIDEGKPVTFSDTSINAVRALVGDAVFVQGAFPQSLTEEARRTQYAFVHLDCDLYRPIRDGLEFFWQRLSPGGVLIVHDYSSGAWPGATKAVDEFIAQEQVAPVLLPDKSGSVVFTRPR